MQKCFKNVKSWVNDERKMRQKKNYVGEKKRKKCATMLKKNS